MSPARKKAGVNAYAGDVTPQEAWERLQSDPQAMLVDVRTPEEWRSIGLPDLRSAKGRLAKISWKLFPNYTLNPDFVAQFKATGANRNALLYFLCRSGGRSTDAAIAMAAAGYAKCYNITGGFEGKPDASGQRGTVEGWKAAGLPWGLA